MTSKTNRTFFDLFNDQQIVLHVKSYPASEEIPKTILIKNILQPQLSSDGKQFIETICTDIRLNEFLQFYRNYDSFEIGTPITPLNCIKRPLVRQVSASEIIKFTSQYMPGGQWSWIIDLSKSKSLFRRTEKWIAFAEIDNGPACLTIFLEGENAGCIYYVTPQPHFNNLKPIAKSYNLLLDRIAKGPAAFFKLIRAYIVMKENDGQNYGYVPTAYIDNNKFHSITDKQDKI